jgi:hypothetical protein
MIKKLLETLRALICFVVIFQLAGCGTILYPERRGQKTGNIDPGIAILDAIGLFFFIIPGLVAFGVDFTTGTIYLPAKPGTSLDRKGIKQIAFNPKYCNPATIERIIAKETGHKVRLAQNNMKIAKLHSVDDMMALLADTPVQR